jgi:hypothetical protein
MSRCLRLSLACLVFSLLSMSMAAQVSIDAAAYVTSSNPNANYPTSDTLPVDAGTTSYIRFSPDTLPSHSCVGKAVLRLHVNGVTAPGTFDVYQVNGGWAEGTLTFNTAPSLGASATGNRPRAVSPSDLGTFIQVDITALVRNWFNGTTPNNGIALNSYHW